MKITSANHQTPDTRLHTHSQTEACQWWPWGKITVSISKRSFQMEGGWLGGGVGGGMRGGGGGGGGEYNDRGATYAIDKTKRHGYNRKPQVGYELFF